MLAVMRPPTSQVIQQLQAQGVAPAQVPQFQSMQLGFPAISTPIARYVTLAAMILGAVGGAWAGKKVGWVAGAVGGAGVAGLLAWRFLGPSPAVSAPVAPAAG